MRVLLLEDGRDGARRVVSALAQAELHEVTCVTRAGEMLRRIGAARHDVLILDGLDENLEPLRQLRAVDAHVPTLLLFEGDEARRRVAGLRAGADDCMAKPFDEEELVARLDALVRRSRPETGAQAHVLGDLEVRLRARSAHWCGRHIDLSPKEFDILRILIERAGTIVSREQMWSACWPEHSIEPQMNVIDVNLYRLRGKLEVVAGTPLIRTVRRQGFTLPLNP
ncbi:response regulator transcription factor [Sphingomonas quercus]|uniref:Response regulator transcription factor n=1 Tax=Sphingomonas quercus TaxID=2842451 RepID=A0ABS6BKP5_9SPHN|nr:response regulator transcription factor [Sphingomonas quercus]MBU3078869.1 response regulator transcription factor [Sphingomonas quercus]